VDSVPARRGHGAFQRRLTCACLRKSCGIRRSGSNDWPEWSRSFGPTTFLRKCPAQKSPSSSLAPAPDAISEFPRGDPGAISAAQAQLASSGSRRGRDHRRGGLRRAHRPASRPRRCFPRFPPPGTGSRPKPALTLTRSGLVWPVASPPLTPWRQHSAWARPMC
jgi:hypothetical protein